MSTTSILIDNTNVPSSKSSWSRFKQWLLRKMERYACCGSSDDYAALALYRTDTRVRECVRAEMRQHLGYDGRESCVDNAIDTVLRDTGYDLADMGSIRRANRGVKRTIKEWDAYFERMGIDPFAVTKGGEAKIVPKFAAACALHIRTKLGALPNNEANVLLVQRKYLELCRKHGVRDVDIVLHQGFVMNTVFTESVLDEVATSRRRLPAWIRFLEDVPSTRTVTPTIC